MARLFALVLLAHTVLAVAMLISCLAAEGDEIRTLPRLAWAPIIVLVPLIGPIAWFLAGRPAPEGDSGRWPFNRPWARPPVAPDDDPDFLRSLDSKRSRADRELFERWEQDLRRREDDLRRNQTDDLHRNQGDDRRHQTEEGQPEG